FSNPIYQLSEWWTGQSRILNKCVVTIRKFADDRIKEKRELLATGVDDVAKKGYRDLLDLYLDVNVEGKGLTDKQLRDMVLNMMIAGRDTTAQSLSWAIWLLSSRPKVVEAIRKELDEMTNGEVPTYDEVSTLKYANAVFLETLRLYPSVPANIKICVKEDILPGGLHIPKGTEINWLPYAMGRMESIWGPDATEFIPERWIDANGNIKREPIHKFPAFNGGPRTCLAKVASGVGLTLNMSSGLKMQVKLRQ
ncbi:cytochrome P450, partial [Chytridium lagenaria]